MTDAFDSDVLIYAAESDHPLGRRIEALFRAAELLDAPAGVGSVLLLPETLSRPAREENADELVRLAGLLARLELRPVDMATADLAAGFGAAYRLRCADAVHLATAVTAGADRFLTNNRRDFRRPIAEIDVVFPEDLPDPVD